MSIDILNELSAATGFDIGYLRAHSDHTYAFYGKASISKKTGGKRTLYIPSSELKVIQYYLLDHYLSKMEISPYAMAYVKGKSVFQNALLHQNNTCFLHLDIQDFFNCIKEQQLTDQMKASPIFSGWEDPELHQTILFLMRKGHFPQGAVTSPMVSNIIFKPLDEEIAAIVQTIPNGVYTRYSDDITISSSVPIDPSVKKQISRLLTSNGFPINEKKTFFTTAKQTPKVTGITIVNGHPSLSEKYRSILRCNIYRYLRGKPSLPYDVLKGRLSYLTMVDPAYFDYLKEKYRNCGSRPLYDRLFPSVLR